MQKNNLHRNLLVATVFTLSSTLLVAKTVITDINGSSTQQDARIENNFKIIDELLVDIQSTLKEIKIIEDRINHKMTHKEEGILKARYKGMKRDIAKCQVLIEKYKDNPTKVEQYKKDLEIIQKSYNKLKGQL